MSMKLTAIAVTLEAMEIGAEEIFNSPVDHVEDFSTKRTGMHTWSVGGGSDENLIGTIYSIYRRVEHIL